MIVFYRQTTDSFVLKEFRLYSQIRSPNIFFSFSIIKSFFLFWQYSFSLGRILKFLERYRRFWKKISIRGFIFTKKVWISLLPVFSYFLDIFFRSDLFKSSRFFLLMIRPTLLLTELVTYLVKDYRFFRRSIIKVIPSDVFGKLKLKKKRSLKKKIKKKITKSFNF